MNEQTTKSFSTLGCPEYFHTQTEDNKFLGAWINSGHVPEVNGPDAQEFSEYSPSRHELLLLASHWRKTALDIELDWFYLRTTGSIEIRLEPYANRRLARIAQTIGDDAVNEAIEKVNQEARDHIGEDDWRIFMSGDESEWQKVAEETQKQFDMLDAKRQDESGRDNDSVQSGS